eukprot:gene31183-41551_t
MSTTSTTPVTAGFGTSGAGFGTPGVTGGFGTSGAGFGTPATGFGASGAGFGAPGAGFGTSGAGFSSTQPTASFGTSTGFGTSFGSAAAAPVSNFGTGFGSTSASTTKPFGGGISFGSTQPASTIAGSAPTAGFGSPSGGFGSTTAGFGVAAGSGFGASSSGFGLGTGSSFGTGGNSFGSTAKSSFSNFDIRNPQQVGQPLGSNMPQPQISPVTQYFEKIQSCYAGSRELVLSSNTWNAPAEASLGKYQLSMEGKPNEDCELKAIMYKKKSDPAAAGESLLKGRQLEQAEQDNVDPENLVPVLEFGIDALKKRFDRQVSEAAKTEEYMNTLNDIISAIEASNTQVSIQFESLRMKEVELYRTLLTIMRKIEVLRNRGQRLQSAELRFKERLEALLVRMHEPVRQLLALNSSVALQEQQQRDCYGDLQNSEDLDFLCGALQKQREGLEYLTEMLRIDIRDMNIIKSERNEGVARRG